MKCATQWPVLLNGQKTGACAAATKAVPPTTAATTITETVAVNGVPAAGPVHRLGPHRVR